MGQLVNRHMNSKIKNRARKICKHKLKTPAVGQWPKMYCT